jgi:hypothetical protein
VIFSAWGDALLEKAQAIMKQSSKLTERIIAKWRSRQLFIRFINGDKLDCRRCNLQEVPLDEAMNHVHDWIVDWDIDLTPAERRLVLTNEWRSGLQFSKSKKSRSDGGI